MAKSLLHRGATLSGSRIANAVGKRNRWKGSISLSVTAAESSDTKPFTCDDRLQPTIHHRNWPRQSLEDSQEVDGDWSSYVILAGGSIIIILLV